jgi:acylphosphatase
MVRLRCAFSGSVQGVGFRATTASLAGRFLISGWVRNEPDGRVTCEAQGELAEIQAFISTLRDRMRHNIHATESQSIPVLEGELDFRINR